MSSSKSPRGGAELPENMATPVVPLKSLGQMIAAESNLPPGHYELVVEYKFGLGRLAEEDGPVGAMAITFGGLGLRRVDHASTMTIEVKKAGRSRDKVTAAVPRKAVKKVEK